MLAGYMPFRGGADMGEEQLARQIRSGKYKWRPEVWAGISANAHIFVLSLLSLDPKKRMTASQALQHSWIRRRETVQQDRIHSSVLNALTDFSKASSFRKACMAVMALSLNSDDQAKVRDAFLKMDRNQDGMINLIEFREVLRGRLSIKDSAVDEAFHALDVTCCNELHYCDFLTAMISAGQLPLDDTLLDRTFHRFDTDGTGFITKENLQHIFGDTFEGHAVNDFLSEAGSEGRISHEEFSTYLKHGEPQRKNLPSITSHAFEQKSTAPFKVASPHHHSRVPRLMVNGYSRNKVSRVGVMQPSEEHKDGKVQPQCAPCVVQ
jgi:calcium-dependent protein kinase